MNLKYLLVQDPNLCSSLPFDRFLVNQASHGLIIFIMLKYQSIIFKTWHRYLLVKLKYDKYGILNAVPNNKLVFNSPMMNLLSVW